MAKEQTRSHGGMAGGGIPAAALGGQKPKHVKKTLGGLWGYLKKRKILLFTAFFMVLLNIGATLTATNYLQPIIDRFLQPVSGNPTVEQRLAGLGNGLMTLACFYLAAVIAAYLQNRLMLIVSQKTINDIRGGLFDHLQELPIGYFDSHTTGGLMSRFTNDVDTLNDALLNGLTTLFSSAVMLVGILGIMMYQSMTLTLITLLIVPLLLFSSGRVMKAGMKHFSAQQECLSQVNGYIEEMMSGQKVVKTFCYEERAQKDFEERNKNLRESAQRAQSYSGMMMPLARNINSVGYAVVAAVGGIMTIYGDLTVGSLIVFLQLVQSFGRPINEASNQYNAIVTAMAGAERIFQVMKEQPEDADEEKKQGYCLVHGGQRAFFWEKEGERIPVEGDVRFENVDFGYTPEKQILKDISLYAKPGQKIAFVGSTGAGKTTIINLVTRFYDISGGKITVDGIDINEINRADLRSAMAVVLQDTHLFTGTIYDNIRYGRPGATDEEVVEAAKLACAHGFIKRLKHGYSTVIEGDGANLSQGQRQLLNIARAAVADSPILILDEATSSVDTRTERLIEKGLDQLMEGRTTFVIAHRLSTVRNSNAILVMEQGRVIERGTHEELLAQKGRYYELYTGVVELA